MNSFKIIGGKSLKGEVTPQGAKNEALQILSAVLLTEDEIISLRSILLNKGFLHADDNYGMDKSFRREIKRVFPNKELVILPYDHPIFHCYYSFPKGLPKVHEHDGKTPQALALFEEDRMILLYTYESDLGDGWEDQSVHENPWEKRNAALKLSLIHI